MRSVVTIVIAVDVIGALSDRTLGNGNFIMMDNSVWPSLAQGTANLCTLVQHGQLVHWRVVAVDLQTPVAIRNIRFYSVGAEVLPEKDNITEYSEMPIDDHEKAHLNFWSGVVPGWMIQGMDYRYGVTVQMAKGVNSLMRIDSPSLRCV